MLTIKKIEIDKYLMDWLSSFTVEICKNLKLAGLIPPVIYSFINRQFEGIHQPS